MIKFISLFFTSTLLIGCTESSSEKDDLLNKIEELQKSNDELKQKNDSLVITGKIDNVPESNKRPSRSATPTRNPTPKPPNPNTNNNTPSEELTDNQPDESIANPFGGRNGGSEFSVGSSNGNPGSGSSMGYGEGKGYGGTYDGGVGSGGGGGGGGSFGEPILLNTPTPPQPDTDFSGIVCVELLINEKGQVISAKSCNSTSHPDQNVVKSVIEYIKKNVKYKEEPGAPMRKVIYPPVYIHAN